jgi:hypothetical protein
MIHSIVLSLHQLGVNHLYCHTKAKIYNQSNNKDGQSCKKR